MSGHVVRAAVLAALALTTACGPTVIDESVATVDTSPDATIDTLPPVYPGAPVAQLMAEIETLMLDLDERIIDEDDPAEQFARIEELWSAASVQIDDQSRDLFNFAQAIELARTGVERRRPADASKGYKILADVLDAYLAR